jgi:hypothetical protein
MKIEHQTIADALSEARSTHFRVSHRAGRFVAGDDASFFARRLPDPEVTFDVSNNKVLTNVSLGGSVKLVSIYRGQYGADDIPGVWIRKDFSRAGPFAFVIELPGERVDLLAPELTFTTSLLSNVFPVTDYQHACLRATTLTFAPISADGNERVRGVVHGLYLTNTSDRVLEGRIVAPVPRRTPDAPFAQPALCVRLVDGQRGSDVPFALAPNDSIWVPALIHEFGDAEPERVTERGTLWWLDQTWSYMKGMTGHLTMPEDAFAAEFLERAVHQCFGSVGMDASGTFVGSNWGTYPTTEKIWMRDYFYSLLPFHMLEPAFFRKGIEWFAEHGTRPSGNNYSGGVEHSLTNALTASAMAGLYYRTTGDAAWFADRPALDREFRQTLEAALSTRKARQSPLFPSLFLSDGYSLGDYHTGSNVFAWVAFEHYARLLGEGLGEVGEAARYSELALAIRAELERSNTVAGAFGPQYLEGVSVINPHDPTREPVTKYEGAYRDFGMRFVGPLVRDGFVDLLHHDGEESDTILMPHYGYSAYDAPTYRNYMRFSMSSHNPVFNPESRGMQWGNRAAATFPGYMNGLGLITDSASLSGPAGYLTEIRKLTDVDGSLWWWPYYNGATYGDVVRHHNCGKCGWASGVFASMFISEILGVTFDGPSNTLRFRPFSPSSSFQWLDFPLGSRRFSASFMPHDDGVEAVVSNGCDDAVNVEWVVRCEGEATVTVDGRSAKDVRFLEWNGLRMATMTTELAAGRTARVHVRPQ